MIERLLSDALDEIFKDDEFSDCFLIEILISGSKVEVYIDSDEGLTLSKCQRISRKLERLIEDNSWMPDKYTLEVSSPGIDRPLKLHRQYKKNIGRTVDVKLISGERLKGTLEGVNDETILIKSEDNKDLEINFNTINTTKVLVSFK